LIRGIVNKVAKTRERLFTVFFMFAVTLVFIAAVSALNLATADIVARNANLFMQRAVMEAADMDPSGSPEDVIARYEAAVREETFPDGSSYLCVTDPAIGANAYVFVRTGAGLWGQITAVVGVDETIKTLTGVTFVEHNETPGLGARIDEAWFKEQFEGKRGPLRCVPEGTRSASLNEFDGITGATITSRAVEKILNDTFAEARRKAAP